MKKIYQIVGVIMLLFCCVNMQAQKFFNLTADEVRIDSVLPYFTYAIPLPDGYADSVYTVSLAYPEFINMPERDVLRYQKISGDALPDMPAIMQRTVVSRKKGTLEVVFCPFVYRNNHYQILVSFMLKVEAKPLKRSLRKVLAKTRSTAASDRYAEHSILATGRWAKIRVSQTGVHQLTDALIRQAGFSNLSKVHIYGYGGALQPETLNGDYLRETDDLKEIPTCTINGRRLFYAQGPVSWKQNASGTSRIRNYCSDYGYYFLTEQDGQPQSVDSTEFVGAFYPSLNDYNTLYENDGYAWYHGGRNLFDSQVIPAGGKRDVTLISASDVSDGTIYVGISAGAYATAVVSLNGMELGKLNVVLNDYDKGNSNAASYRVTNLQESNIFHIENTGNAPIRLDYIQVTSSKAGDAPLLSSASFPVPEYVYRITNQDHHADAACDMVIIIPTSQKLLTQAKRLATFHETNDGLRVNIVPADELYNEFSSGTPDVNAYRRYLKMLYDRAEHDEDMPRYLLLFGDCVWDNRMLTADCRTLNPDDYLLCFESENSFNEVACYVDDGFFCLLDDGEGANPRSSDKLDVAVGRFPVTTDGEAKVLVDKVISYKENKNAGAWQNTLMFMGDDGNKDLHMNDLDVTASKIGDLYPGFFIKKVMWDAYTRETSSTGNTYPEVTKIIKQQQADGALIMDYAGHGSEIQISHEAVLRITDFANFTNTNLPLWVTASCDIMPFDDVASTIGEAAVLNRKGGAVAFFGTTRTVYASYNKSINTAFMRHVLTTPKGRPITIGEAQRLAKNEMITSGMDLTTNKLQYSLLGDPALSLNLPTLQIVVDSINGKEPLAVSLKAGSVARICGHIKGNSDFHGVVSMIVRDTEETITCKQNEKGDEMADEPFAFKDRSKILYKGSDSIRNGKFVITFAVPKDINYADDNGMINLYAYNDERSLIGNGYNSSFKVGGSALAENDSIGPSVYCYLNSPSFQNGGNVNPTPYFFAQLYDADGINAAGNGIGHDLELIIDGEMSKTYHLNNHFMYDFGTYQSGTTWYSIPELEPGNHQLLFRAWDIQNNSSSAELKFRVVKGLEPHLFSVSCTNNPASSSTTFIVSHDRTGSLVDVELEVFDMSGRILWKHSDGQVTTDGAYTYEWNLTTDGGQRLHTGVYLYRVKVACDGSSQVSKARKLIII